MSSFVSVFHSPVGTVAAAVVRHATAPLRALAKALANRREVASLLEADAGMLRDLGLSRSDLACALAEPMWRDPSSRLLVWSIERRAAARAAARDNLMGLAPEPRIEVRSKEASRPAQRQPVLSRC